MSISRSDGLRLEDAPPVMSFDQAAVILRPVWGRDRVYRALDRGELAGCRIGTRWAIPKAAVQGVLDRIAAQAQAEAMQRASDAAAAEAAAAERRQRIRSLRGA